MSQNCSSKIITLGERQFEIPVISSFGKRRIAKLILKTGTMPMNNPVLDENQRAIFVDIVLIGLKEAHTNLTRGEVEELLDMNNLKEVVRIVCYQAGFERPPQN